MELPIQITFHNLAHSEAVAQYVRAKAAKLDALDRRVTSCRVVLEAPPRHAHHGKGYGVRIDLSLPGGEIVVAHAPGDDPRYEDLYAAVDIAFDKGTRCLRDFARRRRGNIPLHGREQRG